MIKSRDLFKEIRDREGMFQAKMGTIKERNGMDLTETEYIKKRLKEYIEELHKNDINDPDNHDGVITHLELDNPEMRSQMGLQKHHYEQS